MKNPNMTMTSYKIPVLQLKKQNVILLVNLSSGRVVGKKERAPTDVT